MPGSSGIVAVDKSVVALPVVDEPVEPVELEFMDDDMVVLELDEVGEFVEAVFEDELVEPDEVCPAVPLDGFVPDEVVPADLVAVLDVAAFCCELVVPLPELDVEVCELVVDVVPD